MGTNSTKETPATKREASIRKDHDSSTIIIQEANTPKQPLQTKINLYPMTNQGWLDVCNEIEKYNLSEAVEKQYLNLKQRECLAPNYACYQPGDIEFLTSLAGTLKNPPKLSMLLNIFNRLQKGDFSIDELELPSDADRLCEFFYVSCNNGLLSLINLLLTYPGIDPAAADNYAILVAVLMGHIEVVKLLLTCPEVDIPFFGYSAIDRAVEDGHIEIPNLFFCWAAAKGHIEIASLFLNLYPETDPATNNNCAIRMASENGHIGMVKQLLQLPGVDHTADNNYAIRMAVKNGHIEVANLLGSAAAKRHKVKKTAKNWWADLEQSSSETENKLLSSMEALVSTLQTAQHKKQELERANERLVTGLDLTHQKYHEIEKAQKEKISSVANSSKPPATLIEELATLATQNRSLAQENQTLSETENKLLSSMEALVSTLQTAQHKKQELERANERLVTGLDLTHQKYHEIEKAQKEEISHQEAVIGTLLKEKEESQGTFDKEKVVKKNKELKEDNQRLKLQQLKLSENHETLKNDHAKVVEKKSELFQEKHQLENDYKSLQGENKNLEKRHESDEKEKIGKDKEIERLCKKLKEAEAENQELKQKIKELELTINKQQKSIKSLQKSGIRHQEETSDLKTRLQKMESENSDEKMTQKISQYMSKFGIHPAKSSRPMQPLPQTDVVPSSLDNIQHSQHSISHQ